MQPTNLVGGTTATFCKVRALRLFCLANALTLYVVLTAPAFAADSENKDVDFGPFMAELQKRIKRNWKPPKANVTKRVIARFEVDSEGNIKKARIRQSSGSTQMDNAALASLASTSPVDALPDGAPASVEVDFTFDYNVWEGGKKLQGNGAPDAEELADDGDNNGSAPAKKPRPGRHNPDSSKSASDTRTAANLEALKNIMVNGAEIFGLLCLPFILPVVGIGLAALLYWIGWSIARKLKQKNKD